MAKKPMSTVTFPDGKEYEIVDKESRESIAQLQEVGLSVMDGMICVTYEEEEQ